MPMTVVELENVKKIYSMGDAEVHALKGISFKLAGRIYSIMGFPVPENLPYEYDWLVLILLTVES